MFASNKMPCLRSSKSQAVQAKSGLICCRVLPSTAQVCMFHCLTCLTWNHTLSRLRLWHACDASSCKGLSML